MSPLPRLLYWRDAWSRADTHWMIFHHHATAQRARRRHRYRTARARIAHYATTPP